MICFICRRLSLPLIRPLKPGYRKFVLSQFDTCRAGIASFCLWELWVSRCAATFAGAPMLARRICLRVIAHVQLISIIFEPAKPSSLLQQHRLGIMEVQAKSIKRGVWCKWTRPSNGRYKLNIDGSARNGITTSGGVVRDDRGDL